MRFEEMCEFLTQTNKIQKFFLSEKNSIGCSMETEKYTKDYNQGIGKNKSLLAFGTQKVNGTKIMITRIILKSLLRRN